MRQSDFSLASRLRSRLSSFLLSSMHRNRDCDHVCSRAKLTAIQHAFWHCDRLVVCVNILSDLSFKINAELLVVSRGLESLPVINGSTLCPAGVRLDGLHLLRGSAASGKDGRAHGAGGGIHGGPGHAAAAPELGSWRRWCRCDIRLRTGRHQVRPAIHGWGFTSGRLSNLCEVEVLPLLLYVSVHPHSDAPGVARC